MPFWLKSNLPTRRKDHIMKKLIDMYADYLNLMKNEVRGNKKDLENQANFIKKLDNLFDINHAASDKLIRLDEDIEFLKLQQQSRSGLIGSVDKKKADKDKRSIDRNLKIQYRVKREKDRTMANEELVANLISDSSYKDEETDLDEDDSTEKPFFASTLSITKSRKTVLSTKLADTLDRTNTSVRSATMILASLMNKAGLTGETYSPLSLPSKRTVHRHRQNIRKEAADQIKQCYEASKSVYTGTEN